MLTVYQILKSENFKYHWRDKNPLGKIIAQTYRQVSDEPIAQIEQQESKGKFIVNAYPDEFKIVIVNIVSDYLNKKYKNRKK